MSGEFRPLADLDVLGDTDELRAQFEAASQVDGAEPSDTYQVDEPTGSIRVTVDHRALLVDVRINHMWSDRIEPGAFAETLFGVYTAAVQKALLVETSTLDDDRPARTRASAPEPELSIEERIARAQATIADNDAKLIAIRRAEPATGEELDMRSEHGYVTLHMRGLSPVGLTANTDVLRYANTDVLREDVLEVFTDAGLAAGD